MDKILIANRGEIAVRIIRSAREMNIKTVAIYSEADRTAPHVRMADEAVFMGPPPSSQSYLLSDKIIEVAKERGAQAIHPGYGFLSENAGFAAKVAKAGLIFIGPNPDSISVMGDKLKAKEAVKDFGIPLVPGSEGAIDDPKEAARVAKEIGFPVLIKAAAGGGGKGMRIVEREEDVEEQMALATSEAKSAFGDGSVFIEKYISSPRHIEIQVLADTHGNRVHLFERECSIQRRHQKVIEEAPSAILTPEVREAMGKHALKCAEACDYVGAGTVEFIMDEQLNYFFLEMNTRLQVEHPVSEMISGLDLVKEQIKVARGEALSFRQSDLKINGHSLELRVYAEDPASNFLPSTGKLEVYKRPLGPGVRVDDGFEEGMDVPVYYDPMIAKLVTHGKDRAEAIARMLRAIQEYQISGIETTLPFGKFVLEHPAFISGQFDTHFVSKHFKPELLTPELDASTTAAAALFAATIIGETPKKTVQQQQNGPAFSAWKLNRTR
ncbi:MAG: acetyl-CoA carboxylase biotin carboxylase subunit [Schleiferiaceae bacterium]|nr:acetyl-CoA carboxylase biotin carboxylase subunit [Schleiferiaceae bacterium]